PPVLVLAGGCPEPMARFIRRQTRISHGASTGAVTVSWAIDLKHRRIHTHQNPVSIMPPVMVVPQTVYPGVEWLESVLREVPDDVPGAPPPGEAARAEPAPARPVASPAPE